MTAVTSPCLARVNTRQLSDGGAVRLQRDHRPRGVGPKNPAADGDPAVSALTHRAEVPLPGGTHDRTYPALSVRRHAESTSFTRPAHGCVVAPESGCPRTDFRVIGALLPHTLARAHDALPAFRAAHRASRSRDRNWAAVGPSSHAVPRRSRSAITTASACDRLSAVVIGSPSRSSSRSHERASARASGCCCHWCPTSPQWSHSASGRVISVNLKPSLVQKPLAPPAAHAGGARSGAVDQTAGASV
jgi:hypothetical protein